MRYLCLLIVFFLTSNLVLINTINAQNQSNQDVNCSENPLEWPWLIDIIATDPECSEFEVWQFNYEGELHVYIELIEGVDSTGVTCPFEPLTTYFDCEGNVLCRTGFLPDAAQCKNDSLLLAGGEASLIFVQENIDENNQSECAENPLEWPWLMRLMDTRTECNEFKVWQFNYEGELHVYIDLVQGFFSNNGPRCAFESLTTYYTCEGEIICRTGFLPDDAQCKNDSLLLAAEEAILIYFHENQADNPDDITGDDVIIFEEFEWLSQLFSPETCADGSVVSAYDSGIFSFIQIDYATENAQLFFQDGTFYCSDRLPERSCIDLYNLEEPRLVWSCGASTQINIIEASFSNLKCNSNGTFSLDITATGMSGTYGIYGFDRPEEISFFTDENTFTFTGTSRDDEYTVFIYDTNLADAAAIPLTFNIEECNVEVIDDAIFTDYPWLTDLIQNFDCNSLVISEYKNNFSWITLEDETGLILYFGTGQLYCTDYPGLSCTDFYNLGDPDRVWECDSD